MRKLLSVMACLFTLSLAANGFCETTTLSMDKLEDKIKGGWAGQVIGCTYGGPTEFRFRGTMIQDYHPIPWDNTRMKWYYENSPGLYDDVYMDLTFVEVFEKEGLDAPAESFALAFANADYHLWHANQAARYNILRGIMPPKSGHWLYNPHSDDIDYQIEADFAGLMTPGMPNAASEISDRIGHIMNYGDGWYGGVYVAAMYSLAFVSDDIEYVVSKALKVLPAESRYAAVMRDVIQWHSENPDDWKQTWFNVQRTWSEDVGCPNGVFNSFNIDASINGAWIILGLLHGDGDFGKTVDISTRCGDDSDCNPANAAGILATMIGYSKIPDYWRQGLAEVEPLDFAYTTMSLNDTYKMSLNHALQLIERNGGTVRGDTVTIEVQEPVPVPLEIGFEGHYPTDIKNLNLRFSDEATFEFDGIGFAVNGQTQKLGDTDYTFEAEMYIDGVLVETSPLPTELRKRKFTPFWHYQLKPGKHTVRIKVNNPTDTAVIQLSNIITYGDKPVKKIH